MMALSAKAEARFLDIICLIIGTIMAYRGIIDFFLYKDNPARTLLGLIFFGGVISIYLIYKRRRLGFWLFVFFDFAVGIVFIFVLQDVWYHHVWPHITYAAVFLPFYKDLHWGPAPATSGPSARSPILNRLQDFAIRLVERWPWISRAIEKLPALQRAVNRMIINGVTSVPPQRPLPLSLWTPGPDPVPRDDPETFGAYVSWPGLVDRSFTGRHLPAMDERAVAVQPEIEQVKTLFERHGFIPSDRTTTLFCFFAQWFTDSFLRTNPDDRRRNTSNHEIDLCQIYGLGQELTRMLRELKGGRLKARETERGIFPEFLADPETLEVKPEFAEISFDPIIASSFDKKDPPHGLARDLRTLLAGIGEWTQTDDRWRFQYAAGLERANSTILYSAINTIFLREHNRLAGLLEKANPTWGDDRLFETARNINIAKLLKIIIEDYINHLSSSPFKLRLEQGFADRCRWYRTNRISLEFNLLYRWHAMVPDRFTLRGEMLQPQDFRFNNALVEEVGVEAILDAASRQKAGRLQLHNTPDFLVPAERASIAFARQFRLLPFNAYRQRWKLAPYKSFLALTGGDQALADELARLYPDHGGVSGVDRVELPVGLLAEGRGQHQVLPPLMRGMVASDAFSQALTNPLLATYVYGQDCFTDLGASEIQATSNFADIVKSNSTPGTLTPLVIFAVPEFD